MGDLFRSGNGEVEAVQTPEYSLYSKKAIVISTGCWTGSLMQELIRDSDIKLKIPVKPRKVYIFSIFIVNYLSFLKYIDGLT